MRRPKRFSPSGDNRLETRQLLSVAHPSPHLKPPAAIALATRRNPGPRAYINRQYDAFLADFRAAEGAFLSVAGPSPAAAMNVGLFDNYVASRAQLMTTNLVTYFNQLPINLPRLPRLPSTQPPRTAIQVYLEKQLLDGPSNLLSSLLALSLPPDRTAANLKLYDAAAIDVIQGSRIATIDGVMQIFRGRDSYTIDTNYGKR